MSWKLLEINLPRSKEQQLIAQYVDDTNFTIKIMQIIIKRLTQLLDTLWWENMGWTPNGGCIMSSTTESWRWPKFNNWWWLMASIVSFLFLYCFVFFVGYEFLKLFMINGAWSVYGFPCGWALYSVTMLRGSSLTRSQVPS